MAAKAPKQSIFTNEQIVNAATGHWGEVAHEVKQAEPYVIKVPDSDKEIVVPVLTRRRRKSLKATQATYLMMGAQLAEIVNAGDADQSTISRVQEVYDEAEGAYDKALFGDAYDEVIEFFDELPEEWWDAMYQAVHDKLVNRVEPPEDVCSKCGQKVGGEDDEEGGEGKDESSSTSSTGTGRKLKAISSTSSA
jgi:hypothetical protein